MEKGTKKGGRTTISSRYIPGTVVDRSKMNGAAGEPFLDKVFYITEGIMLTQIREITGIDGTTLQNWLKRGWVASPKGKYYTKEHLARILLIAMMRDTMQLARIAQVLSYINGRVGDAADDIIPESVLYDYVCRAVDVLADGESAGLNDLDTVVEQVVESYEERVSGAKKRLSRGISVIVTAYYSTLVKNHAENMIDEYCGELTTR
ncbi:MAG: DUF1836 domain-containing protein [Clostridia bacterium]|nr:DUF1836 domain-containing protein [Clostridia bacterium]MBQ4605921.1 DUF1836 domain-containing protein [Clostridia bacterium]